jgi:hypothetical protein
MLYDRALRLREIARGLYYQDSFLHSDAPVMAVKAYLQPRSWAPNNFTQRGREGNAKAQNWHGGWDRESCIIYESAGENA